MNWKFIINDAPLGSGEFGAGFAPRKKRWIGLALAGASLASSIWGGVQSSKAQKAAEQRLANEKAENEAWYRRRYNENYSDTAAGQNMIRIAKDYAKDVWKKAAGAAAVGGGTDADVAEAKEAGNRMVGNTIAQMAATDTSRKDNVDATYRAEKARLNQQQMTLEQQHADNISSVAGGVSDALLQGAIMTAGTGTKSVSLETGATPSVKTGSGGNTGSPGGGGVNPATKPPMLQKMGTNDSNYKILNPYIMQALQGWGSA